MRIPHPSLAKQAAVVKWGYFVMQVLGVAVMVVSMLMVAALFASMGGGAGGTSAPNGAPPPAMMAWFLALGSLGCVTAIVGLVFSIWAIVLLFLFRGQFRKAANQAAATWAAPR